MRFSQPSSETGDQVTTDFFPASRNAILTSTDTPRVEDTVHTDHARSAATRVRAPPPDTSTFAGDKTPTKGMNTVFLPRGCTRVDK